MNFFSSLSSILVELWPRASSTRKWLKIIEYRAQARARSKPYIKMTFKLKRTINWTDCLHVCRYNASKWNGWIMCKLRELNKQKEEGKNCSMDLIEGNAQWHEDIYLLTDTSFDVTRSLFILLKNMQSELVFFDSY